MHLADGLLDTKTALLATGAAAGAVGVALRQVRTSIEPRQMPMLGLGAAFIFAAQMLNFPVAGGTSGHLIGGVLAAVLLGPSAAVLVMTCVLLVQCLVFADGGLMALGANVFNLAVVNVCGGFFVFRLIRRVFQGHAERATIFAAAFAGWFGTVLASVSCAGQLAVSQTVPWAIAFPAMANVHMLVGLGEGLATALVIMAVWRARPDLLVPAKETGRQALPGFVGYGLLISLGLAAFVAPFACPWPDGLERLARLLGFSEQASAPLLAAPMADYKLPLVGSATVATTIAGVIGSVIAFIAAYALARLLVPALGVSKKNAAPGN